MILTICVHCCNQRLAAMIASILLLLILQTILCERTEEDYKSYSSSTESEIDASDAFGSIDAIQEDKSSIDEKANINPQTAISDGFGDMVQQSNETETSDIFNKPLEPFSEVLPPFQEIHREFDGCQCKSIWCSCSGETITEIPQNLTHGVRDIILLSIGVEQLKRAVFKIYGNSLQHLTMESMKKLHTIEAGAFEGLVNLQAVKIKQVPNLKHISDGVFHGYFPRFNLLTIIHSGLESFPPLRRLQSDLLITIDLDSNRIKKLTSNSVKISAFSLNLDYNSIEFVHNFAFNGSSIGTLSLKGNQKLTAIAEDAFVGLEGILHLDLSETSITNLPTKGLESLESLKIIETYTLKTFPSVYKFRDIKEAHLTYSYHCCAFKYPETLSAQQFAAYKVAARRVCPDENSKNDLHKRSQLKSSAPIQGKLSSFFRTTYEYTFGNAFNAFASTAENMKKKRKRSHNFDFEDKFNSIELFEKSDSSDIKNKEDNSTLFGHLVFSATASSENNNSWQHEINKIIERGNFLDFVTESIKPEVKENIFENIAPKVIEFSTRAPVICGEIVKNYKEVQCYPAPDAFNPCEDVMGNIWLRIAVWFVVIAAVLGNAAVMVVLMSGRFAMSVSKFLMCNLAFADFCMGIYLLIIAVIDVHTIGVYFNYAIDWQHGFGCKIAGFITVFASELSIFTLTVITLERWYAITYAIHLNRRLKLDLAVKIMIVGWVYASAMASLPLFGVSSYTKTSICLPMENKNAADVAYLVTLLSINALAFILISACYGKMYVSIVGQQTRATMSDMAVAKRMALLVFTDFACWAPIAFFGLTAISGFPLINVTNSKILLVFFYPLNSCANPFLYAILTKQYRRDFFILLSRYGFCTKRAMKYKGTSSNHHGNHRILSIKGRMAAPGAMLSQASFDGRVKGFYRSRRKAIRKCYSDSGEDNGGRSVVYSTVDLYPESSISGDSSNEVVRIGFIGMDEKRSGNKRKKKGRKRASASNSDEESNSPIQRGSQTRLHRLPSYEREEVLRRMGAERSKHGSSVIWTTSTSLNSIHKSHKNCNFWIQRDSSSGEKSTTADGELLHYKTGSSSRYNAIENASFVTSSQSNSAEDTEI